MIPEIEYLDWDSDFFGFRTAKILGPIKNKEDLKRVENLLVDNEIRLAYYSANELLPDFDFEHGLDIRLVDRKTTYIKPVEQEAVMHPSVSLKGTSIPKERMLELAVKSGAYSRFKIDDKIPANKFEELYRQWMEKSISGELAKEILVVYEGNVLAGFLTLGEKNQIGDLGIMAVDETFRGKGFGNALVSSADNWFYHAGYKMIQVVTQGANQTARNLFEKNGYQLDKQEYFYHFWTA